MKRNTNQIIGIIKSHFIRSLVFYDSPDKYKELNLVNLLIKTKLVPIREDRKSKRANVKNVSRRSYRYHISSVKLQFYLFSSAINTNLLTLKEFIFLKCKLFIVFLRSFLSVSLKLMTLYTNSPPERKLNRLLDRMNIIYP